MVVLCLTRFRPSVSMYSLDASIGTVQLYLGVGQTIPWDFQLQDAEMGDKAIAFVCGHFYLCMWPGPWKRLSPLPHPNTFIFRQMAWGTEGQNVGCATELILTYCVFLCRLWTSSSRVIMQSKVAVKLQRCMGGRAGCFHIFKLGFLLLFHFYLGCLHKLMEGAA